MSIVASSLRSRSHQTLQRTLPPSAQTGLHRGYDFMRRRYYDLNQLGRGRILPDYLIIGAAKAGTTSLYAWLNEHPFVRPAATKQIDFFNWNFYLGPSWYRSNFPRERDRERFEADHGAPFISGEATPNYLAFSFLTAHRAAAVIPDAKVIVILRDPVARAYSQYQMARRTGWETLPFEEANQQEQARVDGEVERMLADYKYRSWNSRLAYVGSSLYADQLEPWLEHFPRDRFHFLRSEDLAGDPVTTLDSVYSFLGLAPHRLAEYHNLNVGGSDKPISPETRQALAAYYAPHNQRLYDLVGIDFGW